VKLTCPDGGCRLRQDDGTELNRSVIPGYRDPRNDPGADWPLARCRHRHPGPGQQRPDSGCPPCAGR